MFDRRLQGVQKANYKGVGQTERMHTTKQGFLESLPILYRGRLQL